MSMHVSFPLKLVHGDCSLLFSMTSEILRVPGPEMSKDEGRSAAASISSSTRTVRRAISEIDEKDLYSCRAAERGGYAIVYCKNAVAGHFA
jgi:hypothetical protein